MKKQKQSVMIANAMELAIAGQPFSVGKMLAPETRIAEKLKLSRAMVRSAIAVLESKGYLARKRGSGTVIQKEIDTSDFNDNNIYMKISPDVLFAGEERMLPEEEQKTIGYYSTWTDRGSHSPVPDAVMNGMLHATEEKQYRLTINRVMAAAFKQFSIEEIKERMNHTNCDGVIVSYTWKNELENLYASQPMPKMYFFTQELEVFESNIVMLATGKAMEKAIEIMAGEGFTRIGCLAYDSGAAVLHNSFLKQYERSMHMQGLEYRKLILKDFSFKAVFEEFSDMQKTSSLPEALYVTDDRLMMILTEVFEMLGIEPGRDIAIISHANQLPELSLDSSYSTMAFDISLFGEVIIDCLDKLIKNPFRQLPGQFIMPVWHEGSTHFIKK